MTVATAGVIIIVIIIIIIIRRRRRRRRRRIRKINQMCYVGRFHSLIDHEGP
jgi:preprotein translocase subunit YajC